MDKPQILICYYFDNSKPSKPTPKVNVMSGSSSTIRILLRNLTLQHSKNQTNYIDDLLDQYDQ
jgi:hypothetical protein